MNKDFITDYLGCILFRLFGPVVRVLPMDFGLYLGRKIGELSYYLDAKHKAVAYSNLKTAFADKFGVCELNSIIKDFYRSFGQNLIEIFFIPKIDKEYIDKYISIEGLDYVRQAFAKKKGVILLGAHAGSWELSNIVCANLGFPFNLFVQEQRMPRLNKLLNSYRVQKGCKIIQRKNQTRRIIDALKNNESIGMTIDQGGKAGIGVKFFGKDASMSTGAVRLALKYGSPIVPAFYTRREGRYVKIIIESPFEVKNTGNPDADIRNNLQELTRIFEKFITRYPKEYLWTYKIWKYSKERNILILNDGKTGHLRQSQSLSESVVDYFRDKNISVAVDTAEVRFKTGLARNALTLCGCFSGKYVCQGCLGCLKAFLEPGSYDHLTSRKPDIIISCGSSLAAVNLMLSKHNLAKSLVVLRPSLFSTKRFDLVVMPQHDRPPGRKNVAVTQGALNLIDEVYLKEQSDKLLRTTGLARQKEPAFVGLLLGGQTRSFTLDRDTVIEVINQVKSISKRFGLGILATTSRRTPAGIEDLVRKELKDDPACKLLVIANEKNIPEAVGGILGLSRIIVVSPESISMISEAASSGSLVIAFASKLDARHAGFIKEMAKNKYIYVSEAGKIALTAGRLVESSDGINLLRDKTIVKEALRRVL